MRFEVLIDQYHDEIYSYLWRMLGGPQGEGGVSTAADLTQDVFLRAYNAYHRLAADSNHRAWLYKIATNCAYTALNRRGRHTDRTTPFADHMHDWIGSDDPSPADQVSRTDLFASVRQHIDTLPPKQQSALIMRYLQGLEYSAIAGALDCSEDSARANVYQALKTLRAAFAAEEE